MDHLLSRLVSHAGCENKVPPAPRFFVAVHEYIYIHTYSMLDNEQVKFFTSKILLNV